MKKKLGQHFLINQDVAEREVGYADLSPNDVVLEIGPGNGLLTRLLAKKARTVIAVEIDKKLYATLKNRLPDNVELINQDILDLDLDFLPSFNKIVSNLPYQISSPVTFKLLKHGFDKAILMYQKEFAQRMVAQPGSKHYSHLTVAVYYKSKCKLLESVSKGCFKPQPRVDSSIVRLITREQPPFKLKNEKFFNLLTRELFNHRRKMIKNIVANFLDLKSNVDLPFGQRRVEQLSPEQIAKLSNILYERYKPI